MDMVALEQSLILMGMGMLVLFAFMGIMIVILQSFEKVVGVFSRGKKD